ncbi:Uncharacterised protein [Mesomycoplasma dispar]|uniref:Uncharacterized protein n=1 Tax=Mesomycoplasma dispar TaxID=86660 RepID=A0AAJ5TCJ0_9BACT|nr:hypothetical protein [Mesomycoplasma dispar]AJR12540.1 hypothetical protein MDIS_01770 [Mesomycoplasma dispar]VEU61704.1 Uncharacterised protein [Mesomycoplasma dispar]
MQKIAKIIAGVGVGVVGALAVGVPLIVIESNKSALNNKSQINLSEIKTDSVKFSIPFSVLKTVPTNKENEKAKITLKNGEKEIVLENNNFKVDKDEVKFTLFNLDPGTEYKLVKVEFSDNNKVDLSNLNTIFKTESTSNQSPQDNEPKNPENPGENNQKPSDDVKTENPKNSDKTDEKKVEGKEKEKEKEKPNKSVNPGNSGANSEDKTNDSENIVKKNADSVKFSYWRLNNFSPDPKSKTQSRASRIATVESIISDINPDLMLLSGMSPASGENVDYLVSNLNKKNPDANWSHISSPRDNSTKSSQKKRYTFLYKKSLLELASSKFEEANNGINNNSQGFASVIFKTRNGKELNLGTVVIQNKANNSKRSRGRRNKNGNSAQNQQQEDSKTESDQSKTQIENLKQKIKKQFNDKNFIFTGTFQINAEKNSENTFAKLLSSYKTLLDINSDKNTFSSFLVTSNDLNTKDQVKIEDISSTLARNKTESVSASSPISVTIDLKN